MPTAKDIRGLDIDTDYAAFSQRRNRLLLIGIDDYAHWAGLQYPVSDCRQFFQILKEHYGFLDSDLIQSLFNEQATADIIFDELYRLQESDENGNPRLGPDDNLILYFSGHGHLDKSLDEGYWVPVDAQVLQRPSDVKKLISVSEVVKILSQVKAHHILLIVDACFSGAFARMDVEVMPGGDPNNPEEMPSRWVLTAGRLDPVPDKSEFAEALRQVLGENDRPRLSVQTLGAAVKDRVAESGRNTPACISLVEQKYEGGEFFFHRSTAVQRTDQAPRPSAAAAKLPERLRQGSAGHWERLKKGRFKHLNIIQLLLTGHNLPGLIDTSVKSGNAETLLQQAVQSIWGREKPHALVLGEGGMGKTVSLVRLWEDLVGQSAIGSRQSAVPVFVALNEYNAIPESEKHDFVLRSIARNCGLAEALTDDWKNAIWDLLKTPLPDGSPSILLLLDGFNEVTVKKDQLLIDLNRLSEQAKGMQMVITSRYVEIQNFTWAQHSEVIELLPLPQNKIAEYLQQVNLPLPEDEALQKLFGNPMMLTLYAGASSIAIEYKNDKRFRFLPTGSYGELLWNFNEAQLARHLEDLEHDPDEQAWHCFLLRCLVPYLAWRMEKAGQFFLPTRKALNPAFNFKSVLKEAFLDLDTEALTEIFPAFEGRRRLLGFGVPANDLDANEQHSLKIRIWLVEKLHMLVPEENNLRFVHQHFRDFFAACHLRNAAEIVQTHTKLDNTNSKLPVAWTERTFPVYLRRMLGEIEGEHHFNPLKMSKSEPMPGFQENSNLARLLDCCRGIFDSEAAQYAVWNIVQTFADARRTFAGLNLGCLDLSNLCFNGMLLSWHLGRYQYLPAHFDGSLLGGKQLFSQGHSRGVNSACYSAEGKKVLSASHDGTVKEWSVEMGECLQTLGGHSEGVNSACYSADGKKVLAAYNDGMVTEWSVETGEVLQTLNSDSTSIMSACYSVDGEKVLFNLVGIKEWSVKTGKCLQTFRSRSAGLFPRACYSFDGKKVLSASGDRTVDEWLVETGECLQTLIGHNSYVRYACYSADGKKVLSASSDRTVKEWLVETGECLQTLIGHNSEVKSACYSADGKKILSASEDCTVKEWSVETGECLQTFSGHLSWVNSACYSIDGKKILSASEDCTVKEWSVETGECLQTLSGHHSKVSSAWYSADRKKILSACWDFTVKEWSVETGVCLQTFNKHSGWVNGVCYSADGKKVLSTSNDRTVKEWSVETGECLQTLIGHSSGVNSAYYSVDGKKILSASNDGTVKEWSVETGQCLQTFIGHSDRVSGAWYSDDGEKVLSISFDVVKEWWVETGECLRTIIEHEGFMAYNKALAEGQSHPGRKRYLKAEGNKILEKTSSGQVLQTYINEVGLSVWSCDFSKLHEKSHFTEEEKERLRMYGAIFSDEDERRWKEAVADAYGDLEDDDEPENPAQP